MGNLSNYANFARLDAEDRGFLQALADGKNREGEASRRGHVGPEVRG